MWESRICNPINNITGNTIYISTHISIYIFTYISTSIPVSTTQHKKVCLRRQSLSFFSIAGYWKHSGWKSFANFSMVLAVMELANTSHRVME